MMRKLTVNSYYRFIFFIFLSQLLSSCGFHLRGQGPNNIISGYEGAKVYFSAVEKNSLLTRRLNMDLQLSKFHLIDDASLTAKHLIILGSEFQVRAIGTDRNGRDNELEITEIVEFIVNQFDESGDEVNEERHREKFQLKKDVNKSSVIARRSYYFDNNDPIGKKAEEQTLRDSMRIELSRKIISQLIVSLGQVKKINEEIKVVQ